MCFPRFFGPWPGWANGSGPGLSADGFLGAAVKSRGEGKGVS